MKKLLIALLIISPSVANAQITLEKSYAPSGFVAVHNLENEGYKYISYDVQTQWVYLYDSSHNLWKSIDAKVPATCKMTNATYPSTLLFDGDGGVEIFVTYYDTTSVPYQYTSNIVDENGSILKSFPGVYSGGVVKFNNSWKLITYNFSTYYSDVYSLPGKLLNIKGPDGNDNDNENSFYPNPMRSSATLDYALPNGSQNGNVQIFNSAGALVRSYPVHQNSGRLLVERQDLPSGGYFLTVTSDGEKSNPQRIIVQ